MIKLCLGRLLPARKEPAAPFELSTIQGVQDLPGAFAQIVQAVGAGVLSPADARALAEVLEMQRNAIATAEHEARLDKLEEYAFPR